MGKRLAQMVAIFAAFSEIRFCQVDVGPGLVALVLICGLFGHLFILTLRAFQVRAFAGIFLSATMFGFMIKDIPLPQL